MSVASTLDLPSRQTPSSGSTARSRRAARAVLVAAIGALFAGMLGLAYAGIGTVDGDPDAFPLWTD